MGRSALKSHSQQQYVSTPQGDIHFTIIYQNRRTIGIYLNTSGVEVRAPRFIAMVDIKHYVLSKAAWIHKHSQRLRDTIPMQAEIPVTDGACFYYLGTTYTLHIKQADCLPQFTLNPTEHTLTVHTRLHDPISLKRFFNNWWQQQANTIFNDFFQSLAPKGTALGLQYNPPFKLRYFKSKWGSCTSNGEISLNLSLLAKPQACIEYVIAHELCHLREMNHSPRFYALLRKLLPDYKKSEKLLKNNN